MNRRNIHRWVADPQTQKPGNHMPTVPMSPAEVQAVTAYLETLK
jgi:cytochrome c oxidase subunit II